MAPPEKQTSTSWSTHDIACTSCRERKIRCGRERPQCTNCKHDDAECEYTSPGKRVNHMKLLCNNVGGLEHRLINIEGELSRLTTLLAAVGNPRTVENAISQLPVAQDTAPVLSVDTHVEEDTGALPTDRHIVRSQRHHLDFYHGPCTLFALCNKFRDTALESIASSNPEEAQRVQDGGFDGQSPVKELLAHICLEAGMEDSFDLQNEQAPVRLPPKQFLMMAQAQFFANVDYSTDIFVQSSFCSKINEIYSRPFTASDESWAICFNTIILLVLGSETAVQGNDGLLGSQFIRPFMLAVHAALSKSYILMGPKLINVQAMALLSIAAQQYFPSGLAESIFSQACVLARTMGLHQAHAASGGVCPEEAQERFKVFRSLYLLDKGFAISRGSICWLPSFDCSLSSELDQSPESNYTPRIQLARLQEEIYRLFHSAESQRQSSSKYKAALSRLEQNLQNWANTHDIFGSPSPGGGDTSLQLEFLAALITAFCGSPETSHIRRALNESRASCMLLLIANGKHDQAMVDQLDVLLLSKSPSRALHKPTTRRRSGKQSPERSRPSVSEPVQTQVGGLLDAFSLPAFFLLARNVLSPIVSEHDASTHSEGDLELLKSVCECFKTVDGRTHGKNYIYKVRLAFERLLEIIDLVMNPQAARQSLPVEEMTHTNTNDYLNMNNEPMQFGNISEDAQYHSLPPLSYSDSQSASPPPMNMTLDSFLDKSQQSHHSSKASETHSAGTSVSSVITPLDSPYNFPPQDHLTFNFSPNFGSQTIPVQGSRKRRQLSEPDNNKYMDMRSGERFLLDFLNVDEDPGMMFDGADTGDFTI